MDNAEWVRSTYEATAKGDADYVRARFRDDVVVDGWAIPRSNVTEGVPWRQTAVGLDGSVAYLTSLLTWIGIEKIEPLNFLSGGNQVAVPMRITAKVLATGEPLEMEAITLWTFDDEGKVKAINHHTDTFKEVEAYRATQLTNQR